MGNKIAIFLVATTACLSCKKEPDPLQQPVYIGQEMKQWFDYKEGSYWIFYDSLNHRYDSLAVVINHTDPPFKSGNDRTEDLEMLCHFFIDSTAVPESKWMLVLTPDGLNNEFSILQNLNSMADHIIIAIPFDSKKTSRYECAKLNEHTINGIVYKDVYMIHTHDTASQEFKDNFYYINREFGFICVLHSSNYFNQTLYLIKASIKR